MKRATIGAAAMIFIATGAAASVIPKNDQDTPGLWLLSRATCGEFVEIMRVTGGGAEASSDKEAITALKTPEMRAVLAFIAYARGIAAASHIDPPAVIMMISVACSSNQDRTFHTVAESLFK